MDELPAQLTNMLALAAGARVIVRSRGHRWLGIGPVNSPRPGGHAFARNCPIERVNTLVTDAGAADETVAAFEAAGITVVRV